MKFKFNVKLLSTEKQEECHCNLPSPLHVAIYKPLFQSLDLKKNALLLGKNAIINITISTLNLPIKLGTFRDIFCHEDLKAFFKENEDVFILNLNDLEIFDKFKVIRSTKLFKTRLMETISLKFPKKYSKWAIPGQIYFGISRNNDQIWKFELIGFSNKFEISDKRDGIRDITFFVAADKAYDVILGRLESGKIKEPMDVIEGIKEEEIELKDKYSKKILQFFREKGTMPSHLDLVSNKIGIPLGYEKQVLQYLFGPIKLNLDTLTREEQRDLERNSKKILNYVERRRRQEKSNVEIWQPMVTDIYFDLKIKIHELRLAFEYINIPSKDFSIKPEEIARVDKFSKIIINMAQKDNKIPNLNQVINKGMSTAEAKKAFKVSDDILKSVFPMWENELQIPHLLFPVDEMVSEHLDKTKEEDIIPKFKHAEVTADDSLEVQITKARFQRATDESIIFTGSPETFLKRSKAMIENELSFIKVKENIISESDTYSGDIIYAYLDKKKQVHFSVAISIDGNIIDETGNIDLIIKSNDLSVAERFFKIFNNKLEEISAELTKDHYLSDSQDILQMVKSYGKGKNWTNVEELTIRLNYSTERAQRILDYMEQSNIVKKIVKPDTGPRYYFPGLT
ncbi:MAG: hypothetical protein HWN67_00750 [Candidatus Helarchaeota archaeon]|nr:hypothetical protein [Candidatus Helarchaeota archaeon]